MSRRRRNGRLASGKDPSWAATSWASSPRSGARASRANESSRYQLHPAESIPKQIHDDVLTLLLSAREKRHDAAALVAIGLGPEHARLLARTVRTKRGGDTR